MKITKTLFVSILFITLGVSINAQEPDKKQFVNNQKEINTFKKM